MRWGERHRLLVARRRLALSRTVAAHVHQLQNRLECLLEEAHIKLASLVSDLLGASSRRMLEAVPKGSRFELVYRRLVVRLFSLWARRRAGPQR